MTFTIDSQADKFAPNQAWMNRRLKGLTIQDMGRKSLGIFVTSPLSPPIGFESSWAKWDDLNSPHSSMIPSVWITAALSNYQAVAIFSNPFNEAEMNLLAQFMMTVQRLKPEAPTVVWVPHTVAPEIRPGHMSLDVQKHQQVKDMAKLGVDGIVSGEPEGRRLDLYIQARIRHSEKVVQALNNNMAKYSLKECIDTMLWDYARTRIASSIPRLDSTIGRGIPTEWQGSSVGKELGRGMFGCVYKLTPKNGREAGGQGRVVKFVAKDDVKDFSDIKCMKHAIDAMRFISSACNRHINIVQLYEVHHSPSHILFIMEDCGPENLHQRLCYQGHSNPEKNRPMALVMIESLILQAVEAIHHLHVNLQMAHRDIKPENMLVKESGSNSVVLKLVDFDMACSCKANSMCRRACGTMPFMAPELLLQKEYNARKSDMWSFGMVLLELLCGVGILEKVLKLDLNTKNADGNNSRASPSKSLVQKIKAAFKDHGDAGKMLRGHCLEESTPILELMSSTVDGVLTVATEQRWCVKQFLDHIEALWSTRCDLPQVA